MAPTTISIARVLKLGVPIAWQEAVEVARAAEANAERYSRRLTVEGCLISTDGTVEVGTNGADRQGADLSGLQLLAILIEGRHAPAELRALAATADDALSSFPSESTPAEQTLTLDWFVHPHPEVEIASLATRALAAAAPPPADAPRASPKPGSSLIGGYKSLPMTFEPRAAELRSQPPIVEDAPSVQAMPRPVTERPAEPAKVAAAERHAAPPSAPVLERQAGPARPVVPERPAGRRPEPPVVEAARLAEPPPVPARGAEPPRPAARERPPEPPGPAADHQAERPSPAAVARRAEPAAGRQGERPSPDVVARRADTPKPVVSDPPAVRTEQVAAQRRVARQEPAATERARERRDPVSAVAQFRAEVRPRPAGPGAAALQVRPAVHAMSRHLSAVIEKGRSIGAVPLVVLAVSIVAAGGLTAWALFSPALPAPLTYRSLGPLVPFARAFQPNLRIAGRIAPRVISPPSAAGVGTSGTVASTLGAGSLRLAREDAPAPPALPASTPAGSFGAAGSGRSAVPPTFTASQNAAPTAVAAAAPPPSTTAQPSPAGRAPTTVGVEPRDRRVYTADDADVEPPTMRRPQLQMEHRADTEASDSYVEVVVDERGEVTQVRLRSSDLSLNDRMIVAAAKAWQFEPAMKDGRPVKYVLRLPVTR